MIIIIIIITVNSNIISYHIISYHIISYYIILYADKVQRKGSNQKGQCFVLRYLQDEENWVMGLRCGRK